METHQSQWMVPIKVMDETKADISVPKNSLGQQITKEFNKGKNV